MGREDRFSMAREGGEGLCYVALLQGSLVSAGFHLREFDIWYFDIIA